MHCTCHEATNLSSDFFSLPSTELQEPKEASASLDSLPSYTRIARSQAGTEY